MRIYLLIGFLFTAILWHTLFCHECSDAKATRPVVYEYHQQDMRIDSVTNKLVIE